jgi:hypothetical protein
LKLVGRRDQRSPPVAGPLHIRAAAMAAVLHGVRQFLKAFRCLKSLKLKLITFGPATLFVGRITQVVFKEIGSTFEFLVVNFKCGHDDISFRRSSFLQPWSGRAAYDCHGNGFRCTLAFAEVSPTVDAADAGACFIQSWRGPTCGTNLRFGLPSPRRARSLLLPPMVGIIWSQQD